MVNPVSQAGQMPAVIEKKINKALADVVRNVGEIFKKLDGISSRVGRLEERVKLFSTDQIAEQKLIRVQFLNQNRRHIDAEKLAREGLSLKILDQEIKGELYLELVEALFQQKNWAGVAQVVGQSMDRLSKNIDLIARIYLRGIDVHLVQEQYEDAVSMGEAVLKFSMEDLFLKGRVYCRLVEALICEQQYARAIEMAYGGISLDPIEPDVAGDLYLFLAMAFYRKPEGDIKKAFAALQKGVNIQGISTETRSRLNQFAQQIAPSNQTKS